MTPSISEPKPQLASFEECVKFHGHSCVGLAFGYRAATAAMNALEVSRPEDEELVALCDTDACGIDAIQVICGATVGKGNLIVRDYGKNVFTFYNRNDKRAVRIFVRSMAITENPEFKTVQSRVFGGTATDDDYRVFQELMKKNTQDVLTAPETELLDIREISMDAPHKAHIFASVTCPSCGETVADAKTRLVNGKRICIPCAEGTNPLVHQ